MRVLLIHPSDPMHAMDVVPLARLVRAAGHEVLSIVPPQASELIAPIDPTLSIVTQDQGLPLRVAAFAPEAFAAIGAPLPESIRSALAGARDLLADATPDTPADAACARLAALLASDNRGQALAGARQSWTAALVAFLRTAAENARAAPDARSADLRDACLLAAERVAEGLGRSREMEGVSRLIATLKDALLHQAHDAADLQTQLEARAATIQERDDQIASLRAEINALGLQLDRMHALGAELHEARRAADALREAFNAGQSGAFSDELRTRIDGLEKELNAERARAVQLGVELEHAHRSAAELRGHADSRLTEIAAARARTDALEAQLRQMHELGAELRRMHGVANELKAMVEARNARIVQAEREAANARELAAGAAADMARASHVTEELTRARTELIQSLARVELSRVNEARLRAEREALDDLVASREAELAEAQTLLRAERLRRENIERQRDRLRESVSSSNAQINLLRSRLSELLASRWRKLGQRLGLAMTLPWERDPNTANPAPPPATPPAQTPPAQTRPATEPRVPAASSTDATRT